jgi:hypothetical protein
MLIGRLITDEQFRSEFIRDPENTLLGLCDRGLELSRTEVAALVNTDPTVWARTADAIDPRLQKASLKNEASRAKPERHSSITTGRETSANFATRWNGQPSFVRED